MCMCYPTHLPCPLIRPTLGLPRYAHLSAHLPYYASTPLSPTKNSPISYPYYTCITDLQTAMSIKGTLNRGR
ncbi:hypothetical protein B484DRAFT_457859 [Ochromonadaceae sp. CCMP2298]|nr:hypothetical protein B484DRAFT_457859 [Ochromonadaceae sp. CCMP2298]